MDFNRQADGGTEDDFDPPFIPAYGLSKGGPSNGGTAARGGRLNDREICAVALALYCLLPVEHETGPWQVSARLEAVNRRI
jgi:hypothetical protein